MAQIGERFLRLARRFLRKATPITRRTRANEEIDLREMRQRVSRGDLEGAIAALEDELERADKSALGWYLLGMKRLEARRWDAAFAAIARAIELDPSHPGAFEQYTEMIVRRGAEAAELSRAKRNFAAGLEGKVQRHQDAVDFIVPMSIVEAIPVVLASPDRLAAATMRANLLLAEAVHPRSLKDALSGEFSELSGAELDSAILKALLARGRYSESLKRLSAIPAEKIPIPSLRRAIRRVLRHRKFRHAHLLLAHLRRATPDDGWVRDRLVELERLEAESERGRERRALLARGYPFPPIKLATRESAVPNRAFYLLHNSLPYDSAGYATRTHGLLRGLKSLGWDVQGVTRPAYPFDRDLDPEITSIPETDVVEDVKYRRLSSSPERLPRSPLRPYIGHYAERLGALIDKHRPFVVHAASNHWNGLAAVTAAREHGLASVYEVRGLWEVTRLSREPDWAGSIEYEFMAKMEADAAIAADRVITITSALRDEMVARGVDASKIRIVPNGVDVDRFKPSLRDGDLAASLGISDEPVIGYVGSVLDYEGIDVLLQAAHDLMRRGHIFKVLVVGDGGYFAQAKALAAELRLNSHVIFTGRVPHADVERYYSIIDIAPLPRHPLPVCEMVSPLKPFEAMAMGKTVVASNVAALAEIVIDDVNGKLHTKGDARSLADALEELLSDMAFTRSLGRSSRDWVAANRNWSHLAESVAEIYQDLGGVES